MFFLFLWFVIPIQAQWIQQNSGTTENLNDVYCISADTVVVVGNNATILRTTDGGTNWLPVSNPASVNLHQVAFADTQTGYAVGDNGTLLKTTDAGVSWQSLTTNTTENLLTLSVVSADTIYTGGTNGLVMKTVDGGSNWDNISLGTINDIIDIDTPGNNSVYIVPLLNCQTQNHASFYKSIDGGNNWSVITNNNMDPIVKIRFTNENEGYFQTCDISTSIYHTMDGGLNFNYLFNSYLGSIEDFFIENINRIWIVGADLTTGANNMAYISLYEYNNQQNDYATYNYEENNPPPYTAIDFKSLTGYVVGVQGSILKNPTGNMGINIVEKEFFSIYPNPAENLITINFKTEIKTAVMAYKIYNLQGQITLKNILSKDKQIDVTSLPSGIYILTLTNNSQTFAQKLIIQK